MKIKKITVVGIITLLLISFNSVTLASSAGTSQDPVVTKSYLDLRINEILSSGNTGGGTQTNVSNSLTQDDLDKITAAVMLNVSSNQFIVPDSTFKPMQVSAGSYLIGKEGTEIILRSGEALAVTGNDNGITDVTAGKDIFNGTKINKDHLMITPRDDGRGFFCTTNSWFMVKGEVDVK